MRNLISSLSPNRRGTACPTPQLHNYSKAWSYGSQARAERAARPFYFGLLDQCSLCPYHRLGVNEHTRRALGTVVSVRRSRDFRARIETMTGATPGSAGLAKFSSPNCIATPV